MASAWAGSSSSWRYEASASSASWTTSSSSPGSNQRSIPLYGFETMAAPEAASSNGRHDEDAYTVACERRVMFRLIRDCAIARVNVLNETSPIAHARPMSPWKSRPPNANSISGAARLGSPTMVAIQSRRNLSP
jgi:hypothetical protein